jgi:16S rRNA (guanine966-N2)-methyltransferase
MRVVGGEWRGRPLVTAAGRATRPTSDKVREAVFDVLFALLAARAPGGVAQPAAGDEAAASASVAGPFAHMTALDLFAGSGALGIEALSRGASGCVFVENAAPALASLRANLARLQVGAARGRVVAADFRRALRHDARSGNRYTLVFVDPPYAAYSEVELDLSLLLEPVLAPGALVVVETGKRESVRLPLSLLRAKLYGDTLVTFMKAGD